MGLQCLKLPAKKKKKVALYSDVNIFNCHITDKIVKFNADVIMDNVILSTPINRHIVITPENVYFFETKAPICKYTSFVEKCAVFILYNVVTCHY